MVHRPLSSYAGRLRRRTVDRGRKPCHPVEVESQRTGICRARQRGQAFCTKSQGTGSRSHKAKSQRTERSHKGQAFREMVRLYVVALSKGQLTSLQFSRVTKDRHLQGEAEGTGISGTKSQKDRHFAKWSVVVLSKGQLTSLQFSLVSHKGH